MWLGVPQLGKGPYLLLAANRLERTEKEMLDTLHTLHAKREALDESEQQAAFVTGLAIFRGAAGQLITLSFVALLKRTACSNDGHCIWQRGAGIRCVRSYRALSRPHPGAILPQYAVAVRLGLSELQGVFSVGRASHPPD